MYRVRLNEGDEATAAGMIPDQDEDALEENQAMTERALNMVGESQEEEEEEASSGGRRVMVTYTQNGDEEDEDEILKNLLNV